MELVVDGVSKLYGGKVWGLRAFSLTLSPGVVGLLGPNGAGKSTLMRILATVTGTTGGSVRWNGEEIEDNPDAVHSVLGYFATLFHTYPNLNAIVLLSSI